MNRTRGAILVLTIIAASVTIYTNVLGLMPQVLFDLIITIEAVVIAELILYEILRSSEETKLTINLHSKKEKVGFSVESENKTIKDAYPMFDGVRYQWEDDDGSLRDAVDLYVGAKPCYFYPFRARMEQGEDGVGNIILAEVKRKRDIYFLEKEHKDIPIRIIGEGNETKKDYKLVSFYPYTYEQWEALADASIAGAFRLIEQKKMPRSLVAFLKSQKPPKEA